MSDILLGTKIRIPPLHGNPVNREHLIQSLNAGLPQRLTLVCAPAGYGKSTLLSEWLSQVGVPAAWLSLEAGENVPIRFWNYFAAALNTIPQLSQSGIAEAVIQSLSSPQPAAIEAVLASLVNGLSSIEERVVLVLDDFHVITEVQIQQDLTYFIDHLPLSTVGLHLVIASRMDPPWPLARWRARGELNELRSANLRFTDDEAFQFFQKSMPLKLSSQEIAALQDRTEGWIAGLQMASVSMQGRWRTQGEKGVTHFIASFTGSHRFILDYLMEEVFSQQPQEMQDFLQQTSILERLSASLCDQVTGQQDSQTMLPAVERANLFLMPLDDERRWYRYHHLFAELLRKALKQNRPDLVSTLHQRASQWYADHLMLSEAIGHALDSGDYLLVNELASGNVLAMLERAGLSGVLRHFERIPAFEIEAKPWLGVAYAWTKAYVDPSETLEGELAQIELGFVKMEDGVIKKRLASHLDAIRAYVAWVKGRAQQALRYASQSLANLPEDDWVTRCHILNIEGLAYQYGLDINQAVQSFEAAIAAGHNTGRAYETFQSYTNLAFAHLLQGHLHLAFSLCQQVLNLTDQAGELANQMPVLSYAFATLSQVQLEWNDVQPALSNARRAVALAEQWRQADTLHFTLSCLAQALEAAGELEAAFETNQRAMQLAKNVSPWFWRISTYIEIRLHLAKGDVRTAARMLAEIEPLIEERDRTGSFLVVKTALLLAQERFAEVVLTVDKPAQELERQGRHWPLLDLLPGLALALHALDRKETAQDVIDRCLSLGEPEGYVYTFVKRGEPMRILLQEAFQQDHASKYVQQLLSAFRIQEAQQTPETPMASPTASGGSSPALIDPLSAREIEVLQFLQTHLSIPEIAGEMSIAPSTLRTHVRNIYLKLDVHGRIEAIQKAKELALF
ncbi:MAG: AAA family ATPase [Anaerolineales bacterium]|nr:AAA family ATPase [Anaerolineales bacterium]